MKSICLFLFLSVAGVCQGQVNLSIPSSITVPEERAAYLVRHYWDGFDFADTAYLHQPEVTEQALSNYIDLMRYVAPEMADSALTRLVERTAVPKRVQSYYAGLFEKYLYESDSPVRNEELYIPVLRAILSSPVWDEIDKIRPAQLLDLVLRNRVGEMATDFTFTLKEGQTARLHELTADYVLLYFYDPDCHFCQETTRHLSASPVIAGLISKGRLKVLAVYAEGDEEAWKNHWSAMPSDWMVSYDAALSLKNEELYDLKSMPTLYLLDRDKKVLLKAATYNQCLDFLQHDI